MLAKFMPLVKQQLGMQALSRTSDGLSPTRLRNGKIVGKVMDTVNMCVD